MWVHNFGISLAGFVCAGDGAFFPFTRVLRHDDDDEMLWMKWDGDELIYCLCQPVEIDVMEVERGSGDCTAPTTFFRRLMVIIYGEYNGYEKR